MRNEHSREFYNLIEESELPLYPGCERYTKLSFLVKMYHIKCMYGTSDKAMSEIFSLLKGTFDFAHIPTTFYEAKKAVSRLGLSY